MNSSLGQSEILALLGEWERLTSLEWESIQAGAWENVSRWQDEKKSLQPRIDEAFHRGGIPVEAAEGTRFQREPLLRERVETLMRLEVRNRDVIEQIHQAASGEMAEADKAVRHLRQIKQSYSRPSGTNWNQYG